MRPALTYHVRLGSTIYRIAGEAIALADRHNRPVRLRFNEVAMTVTKRMSVGHVASQTLEMQDARNRRVAKSPAAIERSDDARCES